MQAEEAVEVYRSAFGAVPRLRARNRRANAVIIFFPERHDDVQSVGGAALEDDDQFFLVWHRRRRDRALQERGNRAHADHGPSAAFQENTPRNFHRGSPIAAIAVARLFRGGGIRPTSRY